MPRNKDGGWTLDGPGSFTGEFDRPYDKKDETGLEGKKKRKRAGREKMKEEAEEE